MFFNSFPISLLLCLKVRLSLLFVSSFGFSLLCFVFFLKARLSLLIVVMMGLGSCSQGNSLFPLCLHIRVPPPSLLFSSKVRLYLLFSIFLAVKLSWFSFSTTEIGILMELGASTLPG